MEETREKMALVLGRLKDLGLGNPDGIPSSLAQASNAELQAIADRDSERLVEPTDQACTACIDGRRCNCNADGSEPKVRLRRVGGSASNYGVALNAEASIIDTLDPESPLGAQIGIVDESVGGRSAHLGCGGANGEVEDHRAIAEKPAILSATKAFMEIPQVREYLGVGYDDGLGERVRKNADTTAEYLTQKGWDGQTYVEGVEASYPENVAYLEVDENDKFHGHKEPKLTIIIGDKTAPLDEDGFVWNLRASKEAAEKLAGQRGEEGYRQVLIAEIAKHMAVADRLASTETPVILQVA